MRTRNAAVRAAAGAATALALAVTAAPAHELDHAPPSAPPPSVPSPVFDSGGNKAEWELLGTLPTGNPHTDLDFFRQDGEMFASVGTLAIGPNGGGQHIIQLTDGGEVAPPQAVSSIPTASCTSNPAAALGLQHDVEATPKGGTILNTQGATATGGDAQLVLDATDQRGRCHDQGTGLGFSGPPRGGLEIIDVTDRGNPETIGLTSHVGEAHTVNVDPRRPHIAYAVTSDNVGVDGEGRRANESSGLTLDGFELVDLSTCMNFPEGTTLEAKRDACRPEVYRYRWPSKDIAIGHTAKNAVAGCHELEVYPNDRLTCAAVHASLVFDLADAFDDGGTPGDFSDDRPAGKPLPCSVRDSSSSQPFYTPAKVTDCVVGRKGRKEADLSVRGWLEMGAPSLKGVRHVGTAFHQGRSAGAHDATEDVEVSHEAELTQSGEHLLVTDERGGGVTPPGATCTSVTDVEVGNGGIHAFRSGELLKSSPSGAQAAQDAWSSYAPAPDADGGGKAIYRPKIRTGVEPTVCTSHVMQQIPGQNRIFMGWYSQGTQVVDYVEDEDGTFKFSEAGWFLPANTNQWVSHVFRVDDNPDGTFTYYGVSTDFALTGRGRNAIDVYKVTLPAPPG